MTNLINYKVFKKQFVIFLTLSILFSCAPKQEYITKIEGKKIGIDQSYTPVDSIEKFIRPYREHIEQDLDNVLSYAPVTFDKSKGEWQTTIGNLQSDITLAKANKVFQLREHKSVDICLLNHGGIRSTIPKGNITTRTAFEIMPFENNLFVVALKGAQITEMVDYLIKTKTPHPLSGMSFVIDKNNQPKNILVQGQPLDLEKTYYIATNDYLYNGGDSMFFFKKAIKSYDLDYKLRNVLIDYFKETDTVPVPTNARIIKE